MTSTRTRPRRPRRALALGTLLAVGALLAVLIASTAGAADSTSVTITAPQEGTTVGGSVTISGTAELPASGPPDALTVTVTIAPAGMSPTTIPVTVDQATGAWTTTAPQQLGSGAYTATATSSADPGPPVTVTFTVDATAPALTMNYVPTPSTDTTPIFSGTRGLASGDDPSVTVKVYNGTTLDDLAWGPAALGGVGGPWSVAAGLTPGTYTVTADQGDAFNNAREMRQTFVVTKPVPVTAPGGTPPPAQVRFPAAPSAPSMGNIPPRAGFTSFPSRPLTREPVYFASTSWDPDGPVASVAWDLDGDGRYDDAAGVSASQVFQKAGRHTVGLRVTDAGGRTAVVHRTILVRAAPRRSMPTLAPFPLVRITGAIMSTGVRLRLLSVQAPVGARVTVHCRGRGCRVRYQRVLVHRLRHIRMRAVTFPRLRGTLRAGAVLEVRVTESGRIGKYTRFRILRRKPPSRSDACLVPGRSKPVSCGG